MIFQISKGKRNSAKFYGYKLFRGVYKAEIVSRQLWRKTEMQEWNGVSYECVLREIFFLTKNIVEIARAGWCWWRGRWWWWKENDPLNIHRKKRLTPTNERRRKSWKVDTIYVEKHCSFFSSDGVFFGGSLFGENLFCHCWVIGCCTVYHAWS